MERRYAGDRRARWSTAVRGMQTSATAALCTHRGGCFEGRAVEDADLPRRHNVEPVAGLALPKDHVVALVALAHYARGQAGQFRVSAGRRCRNGGCRCAGGDRE